MIRWTNDTARGFKIRALPVWDQARYLPVTEALKNTDNHEWAVHICFFEACMPERGTNPKPPTWQAFGVTTKAEAAILGVYLQRVLFDLHRILLS